MRIPLVKTIYQSAKQVVDAFSISRKGAFRSVVLVEFPTPGYRAVGFVSGSLTDEHGVECLRVFIPTTPNPTTGFLEIIPRRRVTETNMDSSRRNSEVQSPQAIMNERG